MEGLNADLWSRVRKDDGTLRYRGVSCEWVKAHQDRGGFAHPSSPLEIYANTVADALADEAASRLAVGVSMADGVKAMDSTVKRVLDRARSIEAHMISNFPRKGIEPRAKKGRRQVDPELEAAQFLKGLGHSLIQAGRSFSCLTCGASAGSTLASWKKVGCCPGYLTVRDGRAVFVDWPGDQEEGTHEPQEVPPASSSGSCNLPDLRVGRGAGLDDSQASDWFPVEGEADFLEQPEVEPCGPSLRQESVSLEGRGPALGVSEVGGSDLHFEARRGASVLEVLGPGRARAAKRSAAASSRRKASQGVRSTLVPKESLSTVAMRRALDSGLFQRSLHEARMGNVHLRFSTTHRLGIVRGFTVCWKCGAYTSNLRCQLLAKPCGQLLGHRATILSRLVDGKLPPGHHQWPSER